MKLITLKLYSSIIDAEIDKGFLESHQISSFIKDDNIINTTGYINTFGGVKLQVKESELEEAIQILKQNTTLKSDKISLIFDIDGTLWNACPSSAKALTQGLKSLGENLELSSQQIESVAGRPYEECIETLLPGLMKKHPNLKNIFNEYEKEIIQKEGGVFYEGVIQGIKKLSEQYPIYLISNCQDWYLELFLKISQLTPYIQDYDCNGMSHLPKNEMISNMIQKHALQNAVYIGDTAGDEKAAAQANTTFIFAAYGFGQAQNPHLSFNSFQELVDHFDHE